MGGISTAHNAATKRAHYHAAGAHAHQSDRRSGRGAVCNRQRAKGAEVFGKKAGSATTGKANTDKPQVWGVINSTFKHKTHYGTS